VRRSLIKLLAVYPNVAFGLGRGKIFWRAQHSDDHGFSDERRLWYPPAAVTRNGRLNDAGSPCLYLSARPETALSEIGVKVGDHVHLAGFRVLADQIMRAVAIGELSHVQKIGYLRITGIDPDKTIARMINGLPHEQALRTLYIDSYLGEVLSDAAARERDYLATRTLASLVWDRSRASSMFYPSVRSPLGLNLAVLPKAADRFLHSVASIVVRVTKVLRFGYIDFDVIRTATGVDSSGRFEWQASEGPKFINVYRLSKKEFEQGTGRSGTLLDLPTHQSIPADNPGFLRRLFRRLGE
jgi:hypothetical protein